MKTFTSVAAVAAIAGIGYYAGRLVTDPKVMARLNVAIANRDSEDNCTVFGVKIPFTREFKTWWNIETVKVQVEEAKLHTIHALSKRATKRLEQLEAVSLEDVMKDDVNLEYVPLAYKYSRIVRVEMQCPSKSEANIKCAYSAVRKAMVADKVRPHQMCKAIHLSVQLVFVKDKYELEGEMLGDILGTVTSTVK